MSVIGWSRKFRIFLFRCWFLFQKVETQSLENGVCRTGSEFFLFYIMEQNSNSVTFIEILRKIAEIRKTNGTHTQETNTTTTPLTAPSTSNRGNENSPSDGRSFPLDHMESTV